ncbi:MAG: fimbrillin family protein [Bacteroidia bacterium]|nr:fimbrillin family protein [Bacteroidia bacterium]
MKKYLSIIALATLAIVGCSKVNLDQSAQDEETPISFQALSYVSQTKADHVHLALPQDAQFDILAYFHDEALSASTAKFFYFNDVVKNTVTGKDAATQPSTWKWETTNNTYYWPKTGMLSFYAVYPAGKATFDESNPDAGFTFDEYEVTVPYDEQADATVSEDLMLAQTLDQDCNNDADKHYTDGVALLFHHELAKVKFSAKLYDQKNYDSTAKVVKVGDVYFSAVIDEISISNIYGKGTLALNASKEYAWTPSGAKASSGKIVDMAYAPAKDATGFTIGTDVTGVGLTGAGWTKFEEEYYVLPQELPVTTATPNTDATITVKFTVYALKKTSEEGAATETFKVISKTAYDGAANSHPAFTKKLGEFKTTTTEAGDTALNEWKINTVYNYQFIIDPFEGQIYFDPCMEDWSKVDADPEIIYKDVDR